jgi:Uma2 family endonuclease
MYASSAFNLISVEEYLEGEKLATVRHEYLYGYVYAMAGASPIHNIIAGNIHTVFNVALSKRECVVYNSDMKVQVEDEVFYYPDVMVVCQNDLESYFQTRPCVIVEVLSHSTSRKDLHEKALLYKQIPTLELYLIVDTEFRRIIGHYRTKDGWQEKLFTKEHRVPIPCVDIELGFEAVYAKTKLEG